MKNLTRSVAVAAVATCMCTIATAETTFDFHSEIVHFSDLDLNRAAGAATLYQRLHNAAERVCRDLEPGRILGLKRAHDSCINVALSDAVSAINRPALSAYAEGRGVFPVGAIKIAHQK